MDIEFDVSELEEAWRASQQKLHADVTDAVRQAAREGAHEAVNKRHYKDRTAQLTASIRGDYFLVTPDGAEALILAGEDYASYVDDWEQQKFGGHYGSSDSFMGFAEAKAERVLNEALERAAVRLEQNFNSR